MATCKRCGDCCKNMIWETEYPDDELFKLIKEPLNKKETEKIIYKDHEKHLATFGLPTKNHVAITWKKKKVMAIVETRAGKCKHLGFDKEGNSFCRIHKKRTAPCKKYFCRKAKQ